MTMQVFSKDAACPKCGSDDLSHNHRRKDQRLDGTWGLLLDAECELIRTYCRCCGYKWSSLPLDAVELK